MELKNLSVLSYLGTILFAHSILAMDDNKRVTEDLISEQMNAIDLDANIGSDESAIRVALENAHLLEEYINLYDEENAPVNSIEKNIRGNSGYDDGDSDEKHKAARRKYKKKRKELNSLLENLKNAIEGAQQERADKGLDRVIYDEHKSEAHSSIISKNEDVEQQTTRASKKIRCAIC